MFVVSLTDLSSGLIMGSVSAVAFPSRCEATEVGKVNARCLTSTETICLIRDGEKGGNGVWRLPCGHPYRSYHRYSAPLEAGWEKGK